MRVSYVKGYQKERRGTANKKEFKPYIPAERKVAEFSPVSIIMGILLAVIFGAANAYLGLRAGMTVSASIPVAVISMGVTRMIMKRESILESNMVQTIGSAGESLWKEIDGEKTVYEIAQKVKEQYGEEAEPLYERLVAYMRHLERVRFIKISGR